MKKSLQNILLSVSLLSSYTLVAKNPEPVLFGTVTHNNGNIVTGTITWDENEEAFLSDIFNGLKSMTTGIEHLSDDEQNTLLDHQPGPKAQIGSFQITFKSVFGKEIDLPAFYMPFGALNRIDIEDEVMTVTLHDGSSFKTDDDIGDSNDTHADIFIKSLEGETVEYDINDVKSVVFSAAPAGAKTFGDAIYGTVTSELGTFKGRILWDNDERFLSQELDGSDESQDHEIKFSKIKKLVKVKEGNATEVTLRDGEKLILTGTNDVNNGNRGVWLNHPELGRKEIKWSQFTALDISDTDIEWLTYDDYVKNSQALRGTVILTDDTQIKADTLAFDLNQQSQAEYLLTEVNKSRQYIPMHMIKSMHKNTNHSLELTLQNDSQITANNTRNVTLENNGLIITSQNKSKWYQWHEIKSIEFD